MSLSPTHSTVNFANKKRVLLDVELWSEVEDEAERKFIGLFVLKAATKALRTWAAFTEEERREFKRKNKS